MFESLARVRGLCWDCLKKRIGTGRNSTPKELKPADHSGQSVCPLVFDSSVTLGSRSELVRFDIYEYGDIASFKMHGVGIGQAS